MGKGREKGAPTTEEHPRARACARISSLISVHQASRTGWPFFDFLEELTSLTLRAETTPAIRTTASAGIVAIVSSATCSMVADRPRLRCLRASVEFREIEIGSSCGPSKRTARLRASEAL